jgi:hypothetical protein
MYHPDRPHIVRERIIAAEVMKLERRQERERATHPKSPVEAEPLPPPCDVRRSGRRQ